MPKEKVAFLRFNGGEVGKQISAQVNLEKYPSLAEIMENVWCTVQGEMHFRPPLAWRSNVLASGVAALHPFVFRTTQKNLVRLTANELRVLVDGDPIARATVSTAITNGDFAASTGWTDTTAGGTSSATVTGGQLVLLSDGGFAAGYRQEVSVTLSDRNKEHAINIDVDIGPVTIKVGSTSGASDLLSLTAAKGVHSMAFTPTTPTFFVEISSKATAKRIVNSCAIASGGDLVLATPWTDETGMRQISLYQSKDTLYMTHDSAWPQKLERRGASSWSLVRFQPDDGPFESFNIDTDFTVTPSVKTGNGTMTSSANLFKAGHVGALFKVTHSGQEASAVITTGSVFTDTVLVTGTDTIRNLRVIIDASGDFDGTITLQRSVAVEGNWTAAKTYTGDVDETYDDEQDNVIMYYRIGILSGDLNAGTATVTLRYEHGETEGIARVTKFTSETEVDIEVVKPFAKNTASPDWAEGSWSGVIGYPSALDEYDERLYTGTFDEFHGTKAGSFTQFALGSTDADGIDRTVRGSAINWIIGLARLIVGTESRENIVKSTAFDEPITPSNINIKAMSTVGSCPVQPLIIDTRALYVDRSTQRLYQIIYSLDDNSYVSDEITQLHLKVGKPGLVQMAVARQPDTRAFIIREDGQCVVLLFDPAQNVIAFSRMVTDGKFESVAVLPGTDEDEVYFNVSRTIGGETKRFTERLDVFEPESAIRSSYADSHVVYEGDPVDEISVPHLEGKEVVVWADGAFHPRRTVTNEKIKLNRTASRIVAGLYYRGRWRPMRMASYSGGDIIDIKRPYHASLILRDSIPKIRFGSSFENMEEIKDRDLADTYNAGPGLQDVVTQPLLTDARHSVDPRLHLEFEAPYGPVIVQAAIATTQVNPKG